jgi:hypothetical protein
MNTTRQREYWDGHPIELDDAWTLRKGEKVARCIVAKWARGIYQCDGRGTSWLKIKNPEYSSMEGRHEVFPAKRAYLALDSSTISFSSSTTRKGPGAGPIDTDKALK